MSETPSIFPLKKQNLYILKICRYGNISTICNGMINWHSDQCTKMCALLLSSYSVGFRGTKDDVWVANHVSDSEPSSIPIQNQTLQVKPIAYTIPHRQADFECSWSFYFIFSPLLSHTILHTFTCVNLTLPLYPTRMQ